MSISSSYDESAHSPRFAEIENRNNFRKIEWIDF